MREINKRGFRKTLENTKRRHLLEGYTRILHRLVPALPPADYSGIRKREAVRERIRRSRVVYTDETGEKVDGKRHWLWCFTTDTDTLAVIRKSRGKKVLEETLGKDFRGVIVCDGLAHEMARIMYFMLSRGEPYRGENRGLTERKLKNMSRKAYDGLRS